MNDEISLFLHVRLQRVTIKKKKKVRFEFVVKWTFAKRCSASVPSIFPEHETRRMRWFLDSEDNYKCITFTWNLFRFLSLESTSV